jgi:sulfide:quinone oxidoreductase
MPLERFGPAASALVQEQLTSLGVAFLPSCRVERVLRGEARLAPEGRTVPADRVVTLPTLTGPSLSGLPHDAAGFVPVDAHGAVRDAADVYAAGDATDFPIKQGGLATQQADAVAEAIAARCGVPLTPAPFRPLLRGMLLTGAAPCYFETDLAGHHPGAAGTTPLWWPPLKVAGRRLAPFLAQQLGMGAPAPSSAPFSSRDELPAELAGSEDANLESG